MAQQSLHELQSCEASEGVIDWSLSKVTAVMVNSSLDQAGSNTSRDVGTTQPKPQPPKYDLRFARKASQDKEAKQAWEAARKAKQMESLKKMPCPQMVGTICQDVLPPIRNVSTSFVVYAKPAFLS